MDNESRDQILHDFQDCTGLEDVEECIQLLQQYDWNLMGAIHGVHERFESGISRQPIVPIQHTTQSSVSSVETNTTNQTTSNNKRQSDSNDLDDSDQPRLIKTIPGSQRTTKGITSVANSEPAHDLHITIEYFDRTEKIIISNNETVYQLRLKIFEKLPIPPHKQHFLNWTTKSYDDQTILENLHLLTESKIQLLSTENGSTTQIHNHTTSNEFPITVLCEDKTGTAIPHKLHLKSTTTISEMKKQIEYLTHIPIKQQTWQGLAGASDSDELRHTSITAQKPLIVHPSDGTPTILRDIKHSIVSTSRHEDEQMDIDHDNGLEPYEDEDITGLSQNNSNTTIDTEVTSDRQPLIPDECTDDASALEHFSRVFHTRYGLTGPILYIGSLDQAIQDSLYSSINNRRPLAIYLHNDQSVCAHVFCSQVLCADSIIEFLANNYVLWAWDVTSDVNQTKLFETLRRCVGNQCAQSVSSMESDTFPLLLIIVRSRGSLELLNIIEGKSTPTEVLLNLIQSHDSFEQQRSRDTDEETEREKREILKREQEDEYEQSLRADLAKERARQEEQDANQRLKEHRLQKQQECKARLQEEPSEKEKNITRLKIRLPDDEGVIMRRFRLTDNLQVLFDYLTSEGRMLGEYKLLTIHPKRDLATLNPSDTFEELKLHPQEQLILESL